MADWQSARAFSTRQVESLFGEKKEGAAESRYSVTRF